MLKSINLEEAIELIRSNDDIQLLDTRSDMEVEMTGTINGSILVDIVNNSNFDEIISKLDKEKKYLLYCASGERSSLLAMYMDKNGFLKIYNLKNAGYTHLSAALKASIHND